jgi:hypothetical protein
VLSLPARVFDLGDARDVDEEGLAAIEEWVDVLVVNREEAAQLCGHSRPDLGPIRTQPGRPAPIPGAQDKLRAHPRLGRRLCVGWKEFMDRVLAGRRGQRHEGRRRHLHEYFGRVIPAIARPYARKRPGGLSGSN